MSVRDRKNKRETAADKNNDYSPANYEQPLVTWRDDNPGITKLQEILQYIISGLSGLLLLRFMLALLGANKTNELISALFNITRPLIEPFVGLFPFQNPTNITQFEIETLFAIIVYVIGGLCIVRLLDLFRNNTPLTMR